MAECRIITEPGSSGRQTEWNMWGFELVQHIMGDVDTFIFRHPDNDVEIEVSTDGIGAKGLLESGELTVRLEFKQP